MNVKRALKEKSKLVKVITDAYQKLQNYNCVEEGFERPYDPEILMAEWFKGVEELITLKTEIHKANLKVYDKIFRLSELKSVVKQLKELECTNGKISDRYGRSEPVLKESVITVLMRDNKVKELEQEIEDLQEQLDNHNLKALVKVQ